MRYTFLAAKIKWQFLKFVGFILHPWTSDLAVRVIQHFPQYKQWEDVYVQSLYARHSGLNHIIVRSPHLQSSTQAPSPSNKVLPITDLARAKSRNKRNRKR